MSRFELLIALDVVAFIERLPKVERVRLRNRFLDIREAPGRHADYAESDAVGRTVDINICGRFAIKYWTDHADRQIKSWTSMRPIGAADLAVPALSGRVAR